MLPGKDFIQDSLQVLCWAPVDCVQVGCMSQHFAWPGNPAFFFLLSRKDPFAHRYLPESSSNVAKGGSKRRLICMIGCQADSTRCIPGNRESGNDQILEVDSNHVFLISEGHRQTWICPETLMWWDTLP